MLRGKETAWWVQRLFRVRGSERTVAFQLVKTAIAAMIAWLIADRLLQFNSAFLAPYTAVFMVDTTVLRSLRDALQQILAVTVGVLLAMAGSALMGAMTAAVGVVVLVGFAIGRHRAFGASGFWVGVTALLMVTYGTAHDPGALLSRVLLILLGAGVGLAVNALLLPPTYVAASRQQTQSILARLRELLADMARHVRDPGGEASEGSWEAQLDRLLDDLAELRGQTDAAGESVWLNLRPSVSRSSKVIVEARNVSGSLYRALPRLRELIESLPENSDGDEPLLAVSRTDGLGEHDREQIAHVLDECVDAVERLRGDGSGVDRGGASVDSEHEAGSTPEMSMSALPAVRQAVRVCTALTHRSDSTA
ncbi:FUSC family protein [Tomitella cavernea]